jgi:CRISPR-associated protein Csd1
MLQYVVEYAKKHVTDSESGFARRDISWQIELTSQGKFLNLIPIQDRKSKVRIRTSGCPDMPNMRAGGDAKRSQFLIEMLGPAIFFAPNSENNFQPIADTSSRRHRFFLRISSDAGNSLPQIKAVADFLSAEPQMHAARLAAYRLGAAPIEWVKFVVDEVDLLRSSEIIEWWRTWLAVDQSKSKKSGRQQPQSVVDIITGAQVEAADTHPSVRGLSKGLGRDGGDAQAPLVSMDKAAFESYGLKKSTNAAMGQTTAQLYADGLSDLLDSAVVIAGAKICYWYSKPLEKDSLDPFAVLLGMMSDETERISSLAEARRVLSGIHDGVRPSTLDAEYYSLSLSGLKGRVMIRDWSQGNFSDLISNTVAWFDQLSVVTTSGTATAVAPNFEMIATSLLGDKPKTQSYGDWVKRIGSARRDLWQCALDKNRPIPPTVLSRLISVMPAFMTSDSVMNVLFPRHGTRDSSEDESKNLTISRIHARMGLIKAYFRRKHSGGDTDMHATVNEEHPNPAYHCGRLLAVLAGLQRSALGDVGAGVVQRFYAACSQTPGLMLGRLVSNARNHIGKLDGGLAWWYEEQVAAIMARLGDGAPRTLDLEGQGLFALGYYQQLAHLRAGKKSGPADNTQTPNND